MSERLKSTCNVSNADVIDDLTKELSESLSTEEKPDEFVVNPSSSADDLPFIPSSSGDAPTTSDSQKPAQTYYTKDFDYEDSKRDDSSDTDSIDEVSLKDAEVDLTDDQKAERQLIAEQLKEHGNNAYKDGDYERSSEKYTDGLKICPLQFTQQRAILYCNRSAAKMKLEKYDKAIKDCTKSIELNEKYLKAYIRRAQSYETTEKYDESLNDYKKILEMDPSHKEAQKAVVRLPPLVEKKNEELKTEMMGKLKDLGNMILKPFGLSTENFKMEQDPESKGYKINFQQ